MKPKLHHVPQLVAAALVAGAPVLGQAPTLVKDINTNPATAAHSNPVFHDSGAITYFAATSDTVGTELYTTFGGSGGANLLMDIHPGPGNSFPGGFHTAAGKTYFAASNGVHGRELWVTDGTAAGTKMVLDIVPGPVGSHPSGMVSIGSTVYFMLGSPTDVSRTFAPEPGELWKSDGTAAGTVLVKKFAQSGGGNSLKETGLISLYVLGTTLYLAADDGKIGSELWKSDGTTAGTVLVKDIYPGSTNGQPNSSFIQYFTGYQGKVYFYARGNTSDYELWVSDGTAAGTQMVKDIRPGSTGSYPRYLTVLGNFLYFSANDGSSGYELWRTDGTAAGTALFVDINPGPGSSSPYNYDPNTGSYAFAIMGNEMYFRASNGSNGSELWKSDGTVAGTVMVADIIPGTSSSSPLYLVSDRKQTVYFAATGATGGRELYKTDGTAAGTVLVKDINTTTATASSSPGYFSPALLGGVVFRANDGVAGNEPWYTDGTTANTKLLADLNNPTGGSAASNPRNMADLNGTLFFSANDGATGFELWKSDGTAAGTSLVRDINPGSASASPTYLTAMGGHVYFYASDSGSNYELWRSDGTAAGTTKVLEIFAGTTGSNPRYLTAVGDTLYFQARSVSTSDVELWKSDGTAAGTVMVKDIYAGANGSNPNYFAVLNGVLFFYARSGATANYELWRSDGTAAGTVMVKDINPGPSGSYPRYLVSTGQAIFFSANDGASGYELWMSDGTAAGTVQVKDIAAGSLSANPNYITPVGNRVFFAASDGTASTNTGTELYVSDGTAAGTTLVKDIYPGTTNGRPNSSAPYNAYGGNLDIRQFAVLGNEVYFRANDGAGTGNLELWKSDGTAAGTVMVQDINPGGSSNPNYITPVGSRHLFFQADDSGYGSGMGGGSELWMTDGTAAGTVRVTDINPADNSSTPQYLVLSGGSLFVAADDGRRGRELWVVDPGATSQPIGHGCPVTDEPVLTASDPVLGGSITLAARGRPGTSAMALLIGLRNNPLSTGIGGGCHLYVDPLAPNLMLLFKPAANGTWQLSSPIPNVAANKGLQFMVQVGFGPLPVAPLGIALSAGAKLTFGY